MYLWQPIAGTFYAPCVDGDYDMAVIGHEYGHMIENRMVGKGGSRSGHHMGAMGESSGDLMGVEYLNEHGFVPVTNENPFSVGAYVTGNKDRAIRNYGMNFPRTGAFPTPGVSLVRQARTGESAADVPGAGPVVNPLNFSDHGFDITGAQVHADGEIWSATNYDIRQALIAKYNAQFPASDQNLQRQCAEGNALGGPLPPDRCPGNRRWIRIMFEAFVLTPNNAPSMLEMRNAYLAADQMLFGGANQNELWLAFARRGFGDEATSTNGRVERERHRSEARLPVAAPLGRDDPLQRGRAERGQRAGAGPDLRRPLRGQGLADRRHRPDDRPAEQRHRLGGHERRVEPRQPGRLRARARTSSSPGRRATATSASATRSPPASRRR